MRNRSRSIMWLLVIFWLQHSSICDFWWCKTQVHPQFHLVNARHPILYYYVQNVCQPKKCSALFSMLLDSRYSSGTPWFDIAMHHVMGWRYDVTFATCFLDLIESIITRALIEIKIASQITQLSMGLIHDKGCIICDAVFIFWLGRSYRTIELVIASSG